MDSDKVVRVHAQYSERICSCGATYRDCTCMVGWYRAERADAYEEPPEPFLSDSMATWLVIVTLGAFALACFAVAVALVLVP